MDFQEYIKPELLILIPVLFFIGEAIEKSAIPNKRIPLIMGAISIVLCGVWLVASEPISGSQQVATLIFTAITQGILIAGASVYADQIIKQSKKEE